MGAFRALYGHAAGRPDIVRGSYAAGYSGRETAGGKQAAGVNGRQALGVTAGGRLYGAAQQAAGRRQVLSGRQAGSGHARGRQNGQVLYYFRQAKRLKNRYPAREN